MRWAILVAILIIIVTCTIKTLPLLASASSLNKTVSSTTAPPDFRPFVGNWFGHGRFLTFASNGHAHYGARTYRWCGQGIPRPCDSMQGNEIIGGIDEQLVFTRTSGSNAYGTLTVSTAGDAGQPVSVTLQQDHTLALYDGSTLYTLLCSPQAPANACGA